MRRVVEPGRILYIERHLGWSIVLFSSSVLLLGVAQLLLHDPFMAILVAGAMILFAAAIHLLFRKRAFVIRREDGSLVVIDRRFRSMRTRTIQLKDVSVIQRERASAPTTQSQISLVIEGKEEIPFLAGIVGYEGFQLAERLAQDLGCKAAITRLPRQVT